MSNRYLNYNNVLMNAFFQIINQNIYIFTKINYLLSINSIDLIILEIGGGIIKQHVLLVILLVFGITLVSISSVNATAQTNNSSVTVDPVNNTAGQNVVLTAHVNANDSSIVNGGQVKFTVNGVSTGSAAVNNGIATLDWLIPASWNVGTYTVTAGFDGTGTSYSNSTNTSNLTLNPLAIKGYWMFSSDAAKLTPFLAANLKNKGITDVFVCTRDVHGNYHYSELQNAINQLKPYGINVHAWIVCFKNSNSFVDPAGYYSYTKKVYVKTTKKWGLKKIAYKAKKKVRYKYWYKYKGKLKYKWKYRYVYVTKYKYRRGWIYTPVYRYVTVSGYDTSYTNQLVSAIANINNKYDIAGVHLDYVRYSGSASAGHAAYQQPGGANAAANRIANFVGKVRSVVTKQLSAALMPEATVRHDNGLLQNVYYYGQDYTKLSNYLNFLVPMIYEGNYNAGNSWITQITQNIVNYAVDSNGNHRPVYAGLMTYDGDDNPNVIDPDLSADVQSAIGGGASGYVLFRYNIGSEKVPSWT